MRRIGNTNHNPMLAHGTVTTSGQSMYRVSQSDTTSTFTKLTANVPAPSSGVGVTGIAWSNDGNFVAYIMSSPASAQGMWLYQRDGDKFTDISSKLSVQPFTSGSIYGISWSPNNKYLTVTGTVSPYIVTYRHNSADNTFTKLANPTGPAGATNSCAWNPQGTSLAVGLGASPWVDVYNFDQSTETFTKLTSPASAASGYTITIAWSPDGLKLAAGQNATPWVKVWDRSGDTFTVETNPGTTPGSIAYVHFTPDGTQLLAGSQTTPYLRTYTVGTTTFTYVASTLTGGNPAGGTCGGLNISADGKYIAMGCLVSPYMTIYKKTGDTTYIKLNTPNVIATNQPQGAPVWWPTSSTSPA